MIAPTPPPRPPALGFRKATIGDLFRVQGWFLRNAWRRKDMQIVFGCLVAIGLLLGWIAWRFGVTPVAAGVVVLLYPLLTLYVLLPAVSLFTSWRRFRSPAAVIYVDDDMVLMITARVKTRRVSRRARQVGAVQKPRLLWEIGNHSARVMHDGRGAPFRARLSPVVPDAADKAGAVIVATAAHPKLRDRYIQEFEGWGLRQLPKRNRWRLFGSLGVVRIPRRMRAPQSMSDRAA